MSQALGLNLPGTRWGQSEASELSCGPQHLLRRLCREKPQAPFEKGLGQCASRVLSPGLMCPSLCWKPFSFPHVLHLESDHVFGADNSVGSLPGSLFSLLLRMRHRLSGPSLLFTDHPRARSITCQLGRGSWWVSNGSSISKCPSVCVLTGECGVPRKVYPTSSAGNQPDVLTRKPYLELLFLHVHAHL